MDEYSEHKFLIPLVEKVNMWDLAEGNFPQHFGLPWDRMDAATRREYCDFHQNLPTEVLNRLLEEKFYNHFTIITLLQTGHLNNTQAKLIAQHKGLPKETLEWAFSAPYAAVWFVRHIAGRTDLKRAQVTNFLRSGDIQVRMEAVKNPKLPIIALREHATRQTFSNVMERNLVYETCAKRLPEFEGYPSEWIETVLQSKRNSES